MTGRTLIALGLLAGLLVGAGICWLLAKALDRAPDWTELAAATTMPDRRAYTLPLNNPDMVPVDQAGHMKDDDIVLGILVHGQARAYPWWLTSNYHVVNDTVRDDPVLITLCEVCGGAAAFRPVLPELPGIPLSFQVCGIGLGTIELVDHQTRSKWRPFLGCAFEGPLKGRTLENYPVLVMTWKEWRYRYPDGWVVNGSPQLRLRPHGAAAGRIGNVEIPEVFARTMNLSDDRLSRHELVLGIRVAKTRKSYAIPINRLVPFPSLFLVSLDGNPFLVVRDGPLAMTAFDLGPTSYRTGFSILSKGPLTFGTPDGSAWNVFGIGSAPGQPEKRLPTARCYLTEWYEWVSHSPRSEIVTSVQVLPQDTQAQSGPARNR